MDTRKVDVAIVGGGPAGSTAALVLARNGCDVVMIDNNAERDFRIGEGLPPAARPLLQSLGILDQFLADGHLASYGNVSAWGSSEIATKDFMFDPYGHGWHVDRLRFDATLRAVAQEAGAGILSPAHFAGVTGNGGNWVLQLHSDTAQLQVVAPFVFDCSGRRAVFATKQGVKRTHDDRLVAVFGVLNSVDTNDIDGATLVESAPDGWWYASLVPGDCRVIAFFTDGDLLDAAFIRSHKNWCDAIRSTIHIQQFCERCGFDFSISPRVSPASSSRLMHPAGEGWMAAGDAALSFDPLSSQGIITAIASGRRMAEAYLQLQAGELHTLNPYESELELIYSDYLSQKFKFYSLETRWLDRPFWQRRSFAR